MPAYLALKEIWRNKGRFLLIGLIIALITVLVLFVAALAEGLGAGNREYLEKLNADLLVYQTGVDLSVSASRIDRSLLNDLRRVDGVADVGPIGFRSVTIVFADGREPLDISFIGAEPGKPGEPRAYVGRGLAGKRANEALIDRNVARRSGLTVGDEFTIKALQGNIEEFYRLRVAGISDGRQYLIQPSIVVPYLTWAKMKPKADPNETDLSPNIVGVRLDDAPALPAMAVALETQVDDIEAVDRQTAYEATPGYREQQSTLNTQRNFSLLIGVLVIGGFFQIQTLQKVAQVGMLKAIGASTLTVILAATIQILTVTILGVALGGLATLGLSQALPVTVPIIFQGTTVVTAVVSLLTIGPLGGLVSIRQLSKVEPLTALGLAA
jgi:putative ABC transport system permease protein